MSKDKSARASRTRRRSFQNPDVESVFRSYSNSVRDKLLRLRELIFDTAAATEGVGELQETLKWGQPSYLTAQSKSGSTIRIDRVKTAEDRYAVYFHCQSRLVPTFRELYPDSFNYDGKRAIVFGCDDEIPEAELRHCLALALTYHRRKKA